MLRQIINRPVSLSVLVSNSSCCSVSVSGTAVRRQPFHVSSVSRVDDAGAIKDAGGAMAKKGQSHEDQYYRKIQAEQLKKLKSQHKDHIQNAQQEIKRLQSIIDRHKEDIEELETEENDLK
ncbi:ATPase inhibitor mai-1, mitochondrial-like [Convolutriloba macropyga]|uniref:ATPase inhibitor mai-1, mitochondrial-like n=1 Tax=Convolutriloba macropyga TaxID=536237 RepID=UPI003F528F3F